MNIMVFNVPAETVGALTILTDFYNEVTFDKDKNINWIFVLSKPNLQDTNNIKILRFPWIKKSWFHRLFFDNFVAPTLLKKHSIDRIISFQNIIIPHTKVKQILYVHNSLPFINHKFSLVKNMKLWIYQNIIGKKIKKSINKSEKVIVQTNWMKELCIENTLVDDEKIIVIPPKININVKKYYKPTKEALTTFFYPASEFIYKNHKLIVEASKDLIIKKNIKNFRVIFTLKGNENKNIVNLYKEVMENQLPIDFVGELSREQVFEMYTKSVLLFPSYIETFGLPLLEAKLHKGVVIASDCKFSHEILDGYENAYFFSHKSKEELSNRLLQCIEGKITYLDPYIYSNINITNEESNVVSLLKFND